SPTTLGTVTSGGPLETLRLTVVPLVDEVPGVGFCEMTWFCGASLETMCGLGLNPSFRRVVSAWDRVWPTTFGTVAGAGPVMTFTRTVEPLGTDWPAGGSVAVTCPFVFPATKCSTGFRPTSLSACCASVHCFPLTSGTFTFGGPV